MFRHGFFTNSENNWDTSWGAADFPFFSNGMTEQYFDFRWDVKRQLQMIRNYFHQSKCSDASPAKLVFGKFSPPVKPLLLNNNSLFISTAYPVTNGLLLPTVVAHTTTSEADGNLISLALLTHLFSP